MNEEERAVIVAAEHMVDAWKLRGPDVDMLSGPGCDLRSAVDALQASHGVRPTLPGWWWGRIRNHGGPWTPTRVDYPGQTHAAWEWARDPKDPTKAHRICEVPECAP